MRNSILRVDPAAITVCGFATSRLYQCPNSHTENPSPESSQHLRIGLLPAAGNLVDLVAQDHRAPAPSTQGDAML